jgi:hypothetical protein
MSTFEKELTRLSIQRNLVKGVAKESLSERSIWCAVSMSWLNKWMLYVDYDETFAGQTRTEEVS